MPIYEYRCTSCGRTIELLQRVDDPAPAGCSYCEGELEKLFSAPSFQFKGSGWYVTDYAGKKSGGDSGGGEAKADADGGGSSAGSSSDGKSAAEKSSTAAAGGS